MRITLIDSHLTVDYLKTYGKGKTFVETGTFKGDTILLVKQSGLFEKIFSCEINKPLFDAAQVTFKDDPSIQILEMESPEFLKKIFSDENSDRLFEPIQTTIWLDAHASGPLGGGKSVGSPVLDELKAIETSKINTHTIFIDDRRLFGCEEWGGVTEQEALDLLKEINPDYTIVYLDGVIEKDIICAYVE